MMIPLLFDASNPTPVLFDSEHGLTFYALLDGPTQKVVECTEVNFGRYQVPLTSVPPGQYKLTITSRTNTFSLMCEMIDPNGETTLINTAGHQLVPAEPFPEGSFKFGDADKDTDLSKLDPEYGESAPETEKPTRGRFLQKFRDPEYMAKIVQREQTARSILSSLSRI
jgi:hypothetical protein